MIPRPKQNTCSRNEWWFGPAAEGGKANKNTHFMKMCGCLALVPQADKKHLAKKQLRDAFDLPKVPSGRGCLGDGACVLSPSDLELSSEEPRSNDRDMGPTASQFEPNTSGFMGPGSAPNQDTNCRFRDQVNTNA